MDFRELINKIVIDKVVWLLLFESEIRIRIRIRIRIKVPKKVEETSTHLKN